MVVSPEVYYAKIMLFGEYSVICNSMGLTIPYVHYKGELSFYGEERYTDHDFATASNKILHNYYFYLENLVKEKNTTFKIDLQRLYKDLQNGLYFESTIPQSYGIGSSGALCAALFTEYSEESDRYRRYLSTEDILRLKQIFIQMESYFHGISSGIDPLLSYIKYPLLIKSKDDIQTVGIPRNKFQKGGAIFLINTGLSGKTGPLVDLFFKNCKSLDYKKMVDNELIPENNACINNLINGNSNGFFHHLKRFSELQFNHFQPMIPHTFNDIWQKGLDGDLFKLKLCGSGGGGFLLGFTEDYSNASKLLQDQGIIPVLVYKN